MFTIKITWYIFENLDLITFPTYLSRVVKGHLAPLAPPGHQDSPALQVNLAKTASMVYPENKVRLDPLEALVYQVCTALLQFDSFLTFAQKLML